MSKLLSSNFSRLLRDKIFWLGIIFLFLFGVFVPMNLYHEEISILDPGEIMAPLDNSMFIFVYFVMVISSAFCSMFVGEEYSDGTIRNKIVVGHKRKSIYLSNLAVCSFASILMCVVFIIPFLAIGVPLIGTVEASWGQIVFITISSIMMIVALTAIFTTVTMLIQNRAVAVMVCILAAFLLIFIGESLVISLAHTKTVSVWHGDGKNMQYEEVPNPAYLGEGAKRAVYSFLADFLPGGQAAQFLRKQTTHLSAFHLLWMLLYSFIIFVTSTGLGLFFFGKKDLK